MKNKGKKGYGRKRRAGILAAAVLTAALLGSQVSPAMAGNEQAESEIRSLIPENITIEKPVPLGEISLPSNEYGSLSWEDESYVPSSRVESCSAVFVPNEGIDLSWMDGWDEEEGVWRGNVTIVISSLEEGDTDDPDDSQGDVLLDSTEPESEEKASDTEKEDGTPETGEELSGSREDTDSPEAKEGEESQSDSKEDAQTPKDNGEASDPAENDPSDDPAKEGEESSDDPAKEGEESSDDPAKGGESSDDPAKGEESPDDPAKGGEESSDDPSGGEEGGSQDAQGGEDQPEGPQENPDNIFDRDQEFVDDRSDTAKDGLTQEEKVQRAAENHTCDGIFVSGIDLPWYVQFRATSGEEYEFTNEMGANIFRSYEFELWDLKADAEYLIPDGEYVSVSVPVKPGYEYTVEHILPSGAVESIIPSLEGSTLIFSTHSFSPFGIAGNKPVVGGDVSDKNYPETPTPSVTRKPTAAPTSAPSGEGTDKENDETVNKDNSGNGDGNRGTETSPTKSAGQQQASEKSQAVQTGDPTTAYPFIVMSVLDILLIAAVIVLKRKKAE